MDDFFKRLEANCAHYKDMQKWLPQTKGLNHFAADELRGIYRQNWKDNDYKRTVYQNVCAHCIYKFECKMVGYVHRVKKNVIINHYADEDEIIVYNQPFICIDEMENVDIDRERNYIEIDGCLFPKDENFRNARYLENMANSARQSLDAFWGYALSNDWDYFIMLTTDKAKVDRYDDEQVKRLWRLCRQRIQRFDNDAKLLFVPERHEDGALHFHGFVGMERQWTLRPFKLPMNGVLVEQKSKKTGAPYFEFPFWDFGYASCAIIASDDYNGAELPMLLDDEGNPMPTNKRMVAAYASKYVVKQFGTIGYGQRSFYKTRNVIGKDKEVLYLQREDIEKYMFGGKFYVYKSDDERMVLRQKISARKSKK